MLSGFPGLGEGNDVEDEGMDMSKMVQEMNRKKKKSGGFQVTPLFMLGSTKIIRNCVKYLIITKIGESSRTIINISNLFTLRYFVK